MPTAGTREGDTVMMTVQQIQAGLVYVALAVVAVFVMIAVVDTLRSVRHLTLRVATMLIGLLVIALFYLLALLVLATQVYHTA